MTPHRQVARRAVLALTAGGALVLAARPLLADDAIAPAARDAVTKMGKTLAAGASLSGVRDTRPHGSTRGRYRQVSQPLCLCANAWVPTASTARMADTSVSLMEFRRTWIDRRQRTARNARIRIASRSR